MRINKYLATSGVASRRKCDEYILQGKVKVNGVKLTELGYDVKDTDSVTFEGKQVALKDNLKCVYYKLHKPKGYICTANDEKGRKTILDLMRGVKIRIFPVGRLDYDTEGLIILTNDGELTNILTHPSKNVQKTYMATIEGEISEDELKMLKKGVDIGENYVTKPCEAVLVSKDEKCSKVELKIHEGKNRQVRRMFEAIGKNVVFLKRTSIGDIRLGGLSRGEYRELNSKEMRYLLNLKDKAKKID